MLASRGPTESRWAPPRANFRVTKDFVLKLGMLLGGAVSDYRAKEALVHENEKM